MEQEPQPTLPPGQLYRLAWVFYLLMAVTGIVWIGLDEGTWGPCVDEGGLCPALFVDPEGWPLDLLLGVAAAGLLIGIWQVSRRLIPAAAAMEEQLSTLIGPIRQDEAIAIAVISGFAEEFLFRGAVQGSLGWPMATLLFALLHSGPGRALRLWSVYAALAGIVLGGLMEWRSNLLAPVLAHILVNAVGLSRLRYVPS